METVLFEAYWKHRVSHAGVGGLWNYWSTWEGTGCPWNDIHFANGTVTYNVNSQYILHRTITNQGSNCKSSVCSDGPDRIIHWPMGQKGLVPASAHMHIPLLHTTSNNNIFQRIWVYRWPSSLGHTSRLCIAIGSRTASHSQTWTHIILWPHKSGHNGLKLIGFTEWKSNLIIQNYKKLLIYWSDIDFICMIK